MMYEFVFKLVTPNKSIIHLEEIGGKKPLNKGSSGHILSAYNNLEINDKDKVLKQWICYDFWRKRF
jgi:hypothetical protein